MAALPVLAGTVWVVDRMIHPIAIGIRTPRLD
jgi:hypothetical protein